MLFHIRLLVEGPSIENMDGGHDRILTGAADGATAVSEKRPRAVTLLPGDGIGPEVVEAARRVVDAAGVEVTWDVHEVGTPAFETTGDSLPKAVVESIRRNRLALKGPVSTKADRAGFRSVNLELRRRLDLYAQVRWCRRLPGVPSPFPHVDLIVVRETTEDLYAGVEAAAETVEARDVIAVLERAGYAVRPDAALSVKVASAAATRRAVEVAFDVAEREHRSKVTVAHKATVMRATDGLFLETAREVAALHPAIEFDDVLIDNLCAQLARRPEALDVLVMPNMYGDIVSDLAAAIAGGVGLVPGVNIGDEVLLFEPGHGTAPRHAGRNEVNPVATILSSAMLVRALGEKKAAIRIEEAVEAVLADGTKVTYDVRGPSDHRPAVKTNEFADAVIARLSS